MHSKIASLFDEAESRYLSTEELNSLSQYVDSLPTRLSTYRLLRDRELEVMQNVADQLQASLPQESVENLERAIKNALLILRYCAMGMLVNDELFVKNRLSSWISGTLRLYNSQSINLVLFRLLNQRLSQIMGPQETSLLAPYLNQAQALMLAQVPQPTLVK